MEDEAEKLFLLEFLVDNVQIFKTPSLLGNLKLSSEESWFSGQTCVTFQFLNFPALDICEKDFRPCNNSDDKADFKSGKSCLFPVPPDLISQCCQEFLVNVVVHRKMPEGILPEKLTLGDAQVPITDMFTELLHAACKNPDCGTPASKTLKDTFPIRSLGCCKEVGEITVFVRLSCFGKIIVTQFQMNSEKKSFLFKGNEDSAVYQCKKMETAQKKCGCTGLMEPEVEEIPGQQTYQDVFAYGGAGNGYGGGGAYGGGYGGGGNGCPSTCPTYANQDMGGYGQYQQAPTEIEDPSKKDYEEIDAELNGHALVIRVQKKKKKKEDMLDEMLMSGQYCPPCPPCPPCFSMQPPQPHAPDCPARPLGCVGMDSNSIQFTMPKKGGCCPPNRNIAQPTLSYKLSECDAGCNSVGCGACCKVIKIEPDNRNNCPGGPPAKRDCPPDCNKDVFVLRIGKKNDGPDKKAKLELELRTPKQEGPKGPPPLTERDTQYYASDCVPEGGGKGKKGKGKGKGKGKKGKKGKKK